MWKKQHGLGPVWVLNDHHLPESRCSPLRVWCRGAELLPLPTSRCVGVYKDKIVLDKIHSRQPRAIVKCYTSIRDSELVVTRALDCNLSKNLPERLQSRGKEPRKVLAPEISLSGVIFSALFVPL